MEKKKGESWILKGVLLIDVFFCLESIPSTRSTPYLVRLQRGELARSLSGEGDADLLVSGGGMG